MIRTVQTLLLSWVLVFWGGTANGGPGDQISRLVSGQKGLVLDFGRSVDVSGMTVIVGDPLAGYPGRRSSDGAAFLFDLATGKPTKKLTVFSSVSTFKAMMGWSVAIDGGLAVCGAPSGDFADVFDVKSGAGLHELRAQDGIDGDFFGKSVAIDGRFVVVGAPQHFHNGTNSGAAYVFDGLTGKQLMELLPVDVRSAGAYFGSSVAIEGSTVVVGARLNHPSLSSNSVGAAYVFDGPSGVQVAKLVSGDVQTLSEFGASVGISGGVAVVGAPFLRAPPGASNSPVLGAAFLFDPSTGLQLGKLASPNPQGFSRFGASVAIHGDTVVVGAPKTDGPVQKGSGEAYLFDVRTNLSLARLEPKPQGFGYNELGRAVAIDGSSCIVTNLFDFTGAAVTGPGSGARERAAYAFDATNPSVPPSATVRNGSGVNAVSLVAKGDPAIGRVWQVDVDASGHAPSLITLELFTRPTSGVFLPGGELLLDLASPRAGRVLALHSGGTVPLSVPIPLEGTLFGARIYAQAGILGAPGLELTNGLDLVLGL